MTLEITLNPAKPFAEARPVNRRQKSKTVNLKRHDKRVAVAFVICLSAAASAIFMATIAVGGVIFSIAKQLFSGQLFEPSDLVFLVVVSMLIAASVYVFNCYLERRRYITVGDNHRVVYPVDRRDELVELVD